MFMADQNAFDVPCWLKCGDLTLYSSWMKTGSGFRWLKVFGTVWVLVLEWIVGVNKLMIPQVCSLSIQCSHFYENRNC